jgi:hypothetical protein
MAVRNLWLLGGGLAACLVLSGDGYPQQPPQPVPAPVPQQLPPDPAPPAISPVAPAPAPAAAPEPTVDQLLDRLTELRRQKAELEKQEQATVKQLRDKLKAQTERLEKLGIAPDPKNVPVPDGPVPAIPPVSISN